CHVRCQTGPRARVGGATRVGSGVTLDRDHGQSCCFRSRAGQQCCQQMERATPRVRAYARHAMPDLREVEIRIAVAEGVLSRSEADALAEEARLKQKNPLGLLLERGRLSEDSLQ